MASICATPTRSLRIATPSRLAVRKVDAFAGFWSLARLGVRQAGVVHDTPQDHRIGAGGERDERKSRRERDEREFAKPARDDETRRETEKG